MYSSSCLSVYLSVCLCVFSNPTCLYSSVVLSTYLPISEQPVHLAINLTVCLFSQSAQQSTYTSYRILHASVLHCRSYPNIQSATLLYLALSCLFSLFLSLSLCFSLVAHSPLLLIPRFLSASTLYSWLNLQSHNTLPVRSSVHARPSLSLASLALS